MCAHVDRAGGICYSLSTDQQDVPVPEGAGRVLFGININTFNR